MTHLLKLGQLLNHWGWEYNTHFPILILTNTRPRTATSSDAASPPMTTKDKMGQRCASLVNGYRKLLKTINIRVRFVSFLCSVLKLQDGSSHLETWESVARAA